MTRNKNQSVLLLLISAVLSILLAVTMDTTGSVVKEFAKGILMGLGSVSCIVGLWFYSKQKNSD